MILCILFYFSTLILTDLFQHNRFIFYNSDKTWQQRLNGFSQNSRLISYTFMFLIITFFFFLIIFDALVSCCKNKKKCSLKNFYFIEDQFLFRLEALFTVPIYLFAIIVILFLVFLDIINYGIFRDSVCISAFRSSDGYQYGTYQITRFVYSLIFDAIGFVMFGFPLVVTIYRFFRDKFLKSPVLNFEDDISDPIVHQIFFNFCKTEWSVENILSHDQILEYQSKPSSDLAYEIYDKYLEEGALCEVNVSRGECKLVKEMMDRGEFNPSLFDDILKTIMINLSDTYSRFIFTDEYSSVKKQKSEMKEFH